MKKKFAAMMLAALMTAAVLTACGDDAAPDTSSPSVSLPASSENNNVSSDTSGSADSNMVSDENFAIIQENYTTMIEHYNAVAAVYNSDEIAANPEIENVMNKAADLIAQMGEVKQDMLTEESAIELNDLIIGVGDNLNKIVESMELAGGAEGTPVSDETFGILQENWAVLAESYNQVTTAYNNGEIEKSEEFENLLKKAMEILEQIQNISREDLTEEKAVEVNNTMILIQESIGEALGLTG